MRILHTSDWHIGKPLYIKGRLSEFEAFLTWLLDTIRDQKIDTLLIAGDVFDYSMPRPTAQEMYYSFLGRAVKAGCRHIIVTAGNHDSPSFLDAPSGILKSLNIHVIGKALENAADEVLVLRDDKGVEELIVCAVPYLSDGDIRRAEAGESAGDKNRKLQEGIRSHYSQACEHAHAVDQRLNKSVPLVVMGHLFAAGGRTVEDDGVRDLYVGNLGNVSATIFPDYVDYVALGHLHVPQIVNKSEHIRYCGSPLPMGFGEAEQQKIVCVVDFLPAECAGTNGSGGPDTVKSGWKTQVSPIEVPVFQRLVSVSGTRNHIITQVSELVASGCSAWLEIVYKDADIISDLGDKLNELVAGTNLEILCIRNNQIMEGKGPSIDDEETLADLSEVDVFEMCLTARGVAEDRRPDLMLAYSEILALVRQDNVATEPANQKRG